MAKKNPVKIITATPTCPACKANFQADIEETEVMSDPDDPMTFECPDCGVEFEHAYTYAAGVITLTEPATITGDDDEEDEDETFAGEDDEEDDDESDEEDEDGEDEEDEE